MQSKQKTLRRYWKTALEIVTFAQAIYIIGPWAVTALALIYFNLSSFQVSSWILQALQNLFWIFILLFFLALVLGNTMRRSRLTVESYEKTLSDRFQSMYKTISEAESRLGSRMDKLYDYIAQIMPKVDKDLALKTAWGIAEEVKEDLLKSDSCSKFLKECIFSARLLQKDNQIGWMKQEIDGYKRLTETPEYRYCEVYTANGTLYDRKIPLQESLSEVESYQHIVIEKFVEHNVITIPSSEARRIVDTVRGLTLKFLDEIIEEYAASFTFRDSDTGDIWDRLGRVRKASKNP